MKTQNNRLQLTSEVQEDEEASRSAALHVLRPNLNSTATISSFQPLVPHSGLPAMLDELDAQTRAIWSGSLNRPEEMLSAQAHTLDAIFNTLGQKAATAMKSGHLPSTEAYLRMALKAQSQCRTTLEALAEIKAPKSTTFVRQQNVAEQQQVNNGFAVNGAAGHTRPHEKDINTSSNKLISGAKDATLDTRGTRSASGSDSQIENLGALHRATNRARKSRSG
jgi:hypothetical protein